MPNQIPRNLPLGPSGGRTVGHEELLSRDFPVPIPTRDNFEFYAAAKRGELRFQRCEDCGKYRHYPRPTCPACLSRASTWAPVSGIGSVYTWTIVHGPTLPAFEHKLPYNVVDVLLEEGLHFVSELLDCPPEEIRAGLPVQACFVAVSDEITLVKFRRRS